LILRVIVFEDVRQVADFMHNAGIARKATRLRPLAVVKG